MGGFVRAGASTLAVAITAAVLFGIFATTPAHAGDVGSTGPTSSTISVTVNRLRILAVDFQDDTTASKASQQVDIFSGGTYPTYRIYARIKDTRGFSAVTQVDFQGWYKNGNAASVYATDPQTANSHFSFRWTNTGGFTMTFPTTGEMSFLGGIDAPLDAVTHDLTVRFGFGNQVHRGAATGSSSWGFGVTATDTFQTASASGEFGIFRYVTMILSGSPTGTGDPGNTVTLAPSNGITFSANDDFYLEATATDLTSGPNTIAKNNILISAAGSQGAPDLTTFTAFGAADATLDVYGHYNDNVGPSTHPYYSSGTSESATVQVQVFIPLGQIEGTYSGTLSYRLWEATVARP